MARRGDVLRMRRRLGFTANDEDATPVVVLQASELSKLLDTLLVAPIAPAMGIYDHNPLAIPVGAGEIGSLKPGIIWLPGLTSMPATTFEPSPSGALRLSTLSLLDTALRVLLAV